MAQATSQGLIEVHVTVYMILGSDYFINGVTKFTLSCMHMLYIFTYVYVIYYINYYVCYG